MSKRIEVAKSYPLGQSTGDVETTLKGFAENATYYGFRKVGGQLERNLYADKNELRNYIGEWLRVASGGITYEVVEAWEFGDGVFVHWTDSAQGDGETYDNEGMLVFEFDEDDQIKHARAYQHFGPLETYSFLTRKE